MEFADDFNQAKSASNKADPNRNIDFGEARALWQDPDNQTLRLPYAEEPRWIIIGRLNDKLWSAIYTLRNDRVRIISVRRSRPKEEKAYAERRLK